MRGKSNPMLLYCKFKGHCLPPCAPPFLTPLTLPFKNFNRAIFTTYYIKKAAAKFRLNGVLLKLNAHFCYIKNFLSIYRVYYNFVIRKKLPGCKIILKYYLSASLKRLRNIALDPCSATFSNLRHTLKNFKISRTPGPGVKS